MKSYDTKTKEVILISGSNRVGNTDDMKNQEDEINVIIAKIKEIYDRLA